MEPRNIMEKQRDGTVTRRFICGCGNSVYKKNLTTGTIAFLARGTEIQITPVGSPTQNIIRCENCKIEHIVVAVSEGIGAVDKVEVEVAPEGRI